MLLRWGVIISALKIPYNVNHDVFRWITSYHEHETLLQENEEEKLSKEEQDLAWEAFRKTVEWEEVHRVVLDETYLPAAEIKPSNPVPVNVIPPVKSGARARSTLRRCSNLAHLLTLRGKGIQAGSSTVCMECAMEISWENLKRDGRGR